MRDSWVCCGENSRPKYTRPLDVLVAGAFCCDTSICCSLALKSSHDLLCQNQGKAIYTSSARAKVVAICQSQGQTIYKRNATTRIVAISSTMPNPFFGLALGLVHPSDFSPGEMGAGPRLCAFAHYWRLRTLLHVRPLRIGPQWDTI